MVRGRDEDRFNLEKQFKFVFFFFFTKQNRKGKSGVINFPLRARIEEYIRRYFQPKTNVKDLVKLV